jgi:hypothetical protein
LGQTLHISQTQRLEFIRFQGYKPEIIQWHTYRLVNRSTWGASKPAALSGPGHWLSVFLASSTPFMTTAAFLPAILLAALAPGQINNLSIHRSCQRLKLGLAEVNCVKPHIRAFYGNHHKARFALTLTNPPALTYKYFAHL